MNKEMTVAAWFCRWLEIYVRPSAKPAGYNSYYDIVHLHVLPELGLLPLQDLGTATLQVFLNGLLQHGNRKTGGALSAKTVKNIRVVLDVALGQACMDGHIPKNPVQGTKIPKVYAKEIVPMTDEMQRQLEQFLFRDGNYQNIGILVALYTGCRLGEVCALRWADYDTNKGILRFTQTVKRMHNEHKDEPGQPATRLVFSATKGKDGHRCIPVPPVLAQIFDCQRRRGERAFGTLQPESYIVYNTQGAMTDPDNLTHYFGEVLKKLGLPHARYHDIRHTFATRALENGVDVLTVSGILGHAKMTTTELFYLHPRMDAMCRAMVGVTPVGAVGPTFF